MLEVHSVLVGIRGNFYFEKMSNSGHVQTCATVAGFTHLNMSLGFRVCFEEKKKFNINLDDSAFAKERSPVSPIRKQC